MIAVHIKPRGDGRYDIHVYDQTVNGELLVFSNQGYENEADAERIVRRLFSAGWGPVANAGAGDGEVLKPEPVDLTVTFLDGTGRHEMIR